ncbi:MAG: glycosyltransferase family 39 protein [Anaerolineae bacterium]
MTVAIKRRRRIWIAFGTVLLAYLLRTVTLDWQSFWIDEVQAFYFIDQPFLETARMIIGPEENGPLYFLLLWGWRRLTGPSDFAIRYLSDLLSVLTVATTWALARTWFGRRVAALTALLLAISPFAIWFGQEAKMYALHMLLASATTLILVKAEAAARLGRRCTWPLWLAYGIGINLLGYSHFFGAFTIAAQGIILIATNLRRPRVWVRYALTIAIVAVPYLPVVRFAMRILPNFRIEDISKGFVSLPHMVQEFASEYTLRVSRIYVSGIGWLTIVTAVALILGIVRAWQCSWRRGIWVTGLLVLPVALFYPVSFWVPVFSPKYLSATFLVFTLALALALDLLARVWRPLMWVGLTALIACNGWANIRILTDPYYQRTDFRAATDYIDAHAKADDAIVTYAHYVDRAIKRYYGGGIPVYRFQADAYKPEVYYQGWLEEEKGHHTLWLVLHQDQAMAPHNRLREAANALYPQITGVYPNNGQIAVLGYSLDWRHGSLPSEVSPIEAAFSNGLVLVGYEVDSTELRATDKLYHPPSNWLHVTTYWRRGDSVSQSATPFVRLVDQQGGIWGGELQRPPTVFDFDPPEGWDPDAIVEAHYDVNLNPVTPPGTYRLIVGQQSEDGSPVLTRTGHDNVQLTQVQIIE